MRIKEETNEKILLENGGRFYALYNVYSRDLQLIDGHTDRDIVIERDITPTDVFKLLDKMDEEDMARHFQKSQQKLFFMEGSHE